MEKIVEQTLLFDFYGELLTEHQKIIYEDVVFGDLSREKWKTYVCPQMTRSELSRFQTRY